MVTTTTNIPDFDSIHTRTPSRASIEEEYAVVLTALEGATSADAQIEALEGWNELRAKLGTWSSMTSLKFSQNTSDETARQENELLDELSPLIELYNVRVERVLLESPHRVELESKLGAHAFALWNSHTQSFRSEIEGEKVELNKLSTQYTELRASAKIDFDGEEYNLSQLRKFYNVADRDVRHRAQKATWAWVEENGEQFDKIFDDMVKLRHQAARKLGFENFIELGYHAMSRVDYNRDDVEKFRAEVRRVIVPLAAQMREVQARTLGLDELKAWDLGVYDLQGNPEPRGDHDWMVERAIEMFDEIGHGMGEFFRAMVEKHYIDLKARQNKAGGGFCTGIDDAKMPYVFANFNGTQGDVEVFTHEIGHAFQYFSSTHHDLPDYHWPTYESAEIHSMSLEFLTWPHMEKFFGDDAERFRRIHLMDGIIFIPYGVAIDHFQHLVYEKPDATPAERRQMWREMEQMYLPWLDWGDCDYAAAGGRWQLQAHVFGMPFYYIDYTLAQSCALQFWLRAEADAEEAMQAYVELCDRGGEAPFRELVSSAGLISPFEEGCLEGVVERVRQELEL